MCKAKKNEKGIPYGSREHMPVWYSLAWSSRGVSAAIVVLLTGYVTFYATDVMMLDAKLVAAILLGSKIVDAVTDLCIGYIIDHTHTKLGKARPYEIFILLEWVFTVLLFHTPAAEGRLPYIWLAAMYILISAVCSTALGGADAVYMSRTFTTQANQVKAMSVNGVVVMFCSVAFNIVLPQVINNIGTDKAAWSRMAIMFAVPLALIGLLRFFLCKEVEEPEASKAEIQGEKFVAEEGVPESVVHTNLSFGTMLRALLKNKYVFIVVGLMIINGVMGSMGPATTYYFKYMMGDIGLMSIASLTTLIAPIMLIFFPVLSRKIGTTKILQYCAVIGVVGMVIRTAGGPNMVTIIVGGMLQGIGIMPLSMMINTYIIDCMDYGEYKTGVRVEGLIASMVNFANKIGGGIASGLLGLVMGMAGYDGSLEVQSASANMAIVAMYNWMPLAMMVLMMVLAFLYQVDRVRPEMAAVLEKKHKKIS